MQTRLSLSLMYYLLRITARSLTGGTSARSTQPS
jgi:hypothetical protein